jgi:hypothetical protein
MAPMAVAPVVFVVALTLDPLEDAGKIGQAQALFLSVDRS